MFDLKYNYACLLLFVPSLSYADTFCSSDVKVSEQTFDQVKLTDSMAIGEIIGRSGPQIKTLTCSNATPTYNQIWSATAPFPSDQLTTVSLTEYGVECTAVKTSYPGIGLVWYNYNDATNAWACGSKATGLARGLATYGGTVGVKDEFYLVKSAPIVGNTENYTLDNSYEFFERLRLASDNSIKDGSVLYSVNIKGTVELEPYSCTFSKGSTAKSFNTLNILGGTAESTNITIDISCSGLIDGGAVVNFAVDANPFKLNSSFFETSDSGVGVKISYSLSGTSGYTEISDAKNNIPIPLDSNKKGKVYLSVSPYIEKDSGVYPLNKEISFNSSLKIIK